MGEGWEGARRPERASSGLAIAQAIELNALVKWGHTRVGIYQTTIYMFAALQ